MPSRRAEPRRSRRAAPASLALFAATTFLSAFLLFSIQPLFAKMVLPVLGGSSSVWAVALLFFQAALLAGYGYAHLLTRHVPAASTGFVHLGVALLALIVLPVGLPETWREPPPGDPYLWQLGLFAVAVGLPFVAVAANAPLLQAWFARSGHPHAQDPYFLYGASNLGSLIALLGYPFLLEPAFGLTALSRYWAMLYVVLIVAIGACFALVRRRARADADGDRGRRTTPLAGAPTWRDRIAWCGLALVPAALLTAFTTHIATDIASAPLLWVLPLAIYLLTFVLAFQSRLPLPMWLLLPAQLAAVIFALLELAQTKHDKWVLTSGAGVAAFFLAALVAHRTLYLQRPRRPLSHRVLFVDVVRRRARRPVLGAHRAAHLLRGVRVPAAHRAVARLPARRVRPAGIGQERRHLDLGNLRGRAAHHLAGSAARGRARTTRSAIGARRRRSRSLFAVAAVAFWNHGARQLTAALMMFAAVVMLPSSVKRGQAQRSYYGVYRVSLSEGGDFNVLTHGTTLHGAQRLRDLTGHLVSDVTPGTYYYPGSPMAAAVKIAQARLDGEGELGRFGVVGLGAGSLSCYSRKHEDWRFFEIDPIVVDIAAKSNHFTFLANCQPKLDASSATRA